MSKDILQELDAILEETSGKKRRRNNGVNYYRTHSRNELYWKPGMPCLVGKKLPLEKSTYVRQMRLTKTYPVIDG